MRKKPYVEGRRFYLGGKKPYVKGRRLYLGGKKKQRGGFLAPAAIWALNSARKLFGFGKKKKRRNRRRRK